MSCPINFGDCHECEHHDPSDGACMYDGSDEFIDNMEKELKKLEKKTNELLRII